MQMPFDKLQTTATSLALIVLISSCASKTTKVDIEAPKYKVLDAASNGVREEWLDNPQAYAEDKGLDVKTKYFYVSDSESATKHMACSKARARLSDKVATQVATFVDNSLVTATSEASGSDSEAISAQSQVNEETEKISSQLSKALVSNVEFVRTYWEQRDYSEVGGARSLFHCWVLGSVSKANIASMVHRAGNLKAQESPELKKQLDEKMSQLGAEYEKYQKTH